MGYKDSETWCVAGLVCWDLAELGLCQIGDTPNLRNMGTKITDKVSSRTAFELGYSCSCGFHVDPFHCLYGDI